LFVVNSASGTVSSFHLVNGIPVFIDQEYSDGAFPIAVTAHNGTVYVRNAGGSGAVVAFKADGLGRLHEIQNSSTFLTSLNSGASSISVSPNGQGLIAIEKATNSIDVFPVHPDGTLGTVVNNKSVTPGVFATVFSPNGQLIVSETSRTVEPTRRAFLHTLSTQKARSRRSLRAFPLMAMATAGTPSRPTANGSMLITPLRSPWQDSQLLRAAH
jgi:Lactonase, 7-bladed beta-propeller